MSRKRKADFIVTMAILSLSLSACSMSLNGIGSESKSEFGEQVITSEQSTENKIPVLEIESAGKTQHNAEEQKQSTNVEEIRNEEQGQSRNVEEGNLKEQNTRGDTSKEGVQELKGYQYVDGQNSPVTVSFYVTDVLRGEDAQQALSGNTVELPSLGEGEEYIVITLNVAYVEGETETLFFAENIASLDSANLFFALQNGNSNAVNITACLNDNIHNCDINLSLIHI